MKRQYDTDGRHSMRNTGAAIVGAAQGATTGLKDEHLIKESKRAVRNIGALARAVSHEGRRQWQSDEMQELREDARAQKKRMEETGSQAADALQGRAQELQHRMQETGQTVQERLEHGVDNVRQARTYVVTQGREKTQAVAQSARRARRAPGYIKDDLMAAKDSYAKSMKTSWASMAGVAFLGATSFILLTIGLVVAFNALLGIPSGYFITLALYLLGAGGLMAYARRSRDTNRKEAREHVRDVRRDVQHVVQPLRNTFTKRVTTGETNGREKTTRRGIHDTSANRTRPHAGDPSHTRTHRPGGEPSHTRTHRPGGNIREGTRPVGGARATGLRGDT